MAETLKRNTAYKIRIGDLILGKPILNGDKFTFLELGDKKIVRVNLIGNITEKYEASGDKKYIFMTVDDGSGQIKAKAFGEDSDKLKDVSQGQTVLVIGTLKHFNNEVYIFPEIMKSADPRYLLIRKLELEKNRPNIPSSNVEKEKIFAIKDKLLEMIKEAEARGGINIDEIIMNESMKNTPPEIINQEIKKHLEEGIIFEPRPGKLRWLG